MERHFSRLYISAYEGIVSVAEPWENGHKLGEGLIAAECVMAMTDDAIVYDELLNLLAESANADRVLAFRLSDAKQDRLDVLLDKNREGTLTAVETTELDAYERFEHVVRLLKTRCCRS